LIPKVKFGLIGCGAAGKIHARAILGSESTQLCAVCDADERAARALGERWGLPWTMDPDRLFENAGIEAVSIATPHHTHMAIASRAAQAGKHIILEKPFTLNTAEAVRLVRACGAAKVVIIPWLERRYLPFVERAREIVAGGVLGKIVYTRVCTLGYKPRAYWEYGMRLEEYPSSWRGSLALSGGGILLMNGVHQIDLMSCVSGLAATEVTGRTARLYHEVEVEDLAVVLLRYASGALGIIEASCCTFGPAQFPIENPADAIMGVDGSLQLGVPLKWFDRIRYAQTCDYPKMSVTDMKIRLLDDFAHHLREGMPLRCRPEDAIGVLAIIEAAYRSAASGAPVQCCTPED
jgi:UDP-N-acetyl-2-amino-2-deoxyglucuronate dehydrogenase